MTTNEHLDRIADTVQQILRGGGANLSAMWDSIRAIREQIANAAEILKAERRAFRVMSQDLDASREQIAEMERQRDAVVILLRAKTDTATWEGYPESLQAAVGAEFTALAAERDRAVEALLEIIGKFRGVQCQEPICDGLIGATLEIARAALSAAPPQPKEK